MSLLNAAWSWDSASTSACTSASTSRSSSSPQSSSPKSHASAQFTCPATASSASASTSTLAVSTTTTASTSVACSTTRPYTSKSDAFFSSYAAMEPIKPPSPICSRRASESCLPPPCAAPARLAVKVATQAASSSSSPSSSSATTTTRPSPCNNPAATAMRERFSSLPDIHEHQRSPRGLGIRSSQSAPFQSLLASSASSSPIASSSSSSSRSISANSSGSSSPSSSRNRQQSSSSAIEEIEARLQQAIASFGDGDSDNNNAAAAEEEEEGDEDMYNDTPSSSSSRSSSAASSNRTILQSNANASALRQREVQQQQSVFEEEEDDDDENGGTTIRIRLAGAGDSMSRIGRAYEQYTDEEEEDIFEPCYPLTPLEIIYKPLHRIRRNRSLRRALSDSCSSHALQSKNQFLRRQQQERKEGSEEMQRKVSFCENVQVVDVFSAIDYPARRGPPPIERLTMRDVLELRQIKLELAAYMGEESPELEEEEEEKEEKCDDMKTDLIETSEISLPTTPALESSGPILEEDCQATPMPLSRKAHAAGERETEEHHPGPDSEQDEAMSNSLITVSTCSSASIALGPGMQIDLDSLIAHSSSSTPSTESEISFSQEKTIITGSSDPSSEASIGTTISSSSLSGYSSPCSSMPSSESNSLSCSPATSDSEFSGSGTLSSFEEYDDVLRRGPGGDTSCEDEEYDDEHEDEDNGDHHNILNSGNDSARTPTRLSSIRRPGQFAPPIPQVEKKRNSMNEADMVGAGEKLDLGGIQISLPALANDGYSTPTTFDLCPLSHRDPWNPSTF